MNRMAGVSKHDPLTDKSPDLRGNIFSTRRRVIHDLDVNGLCGCGRRARAGLSGVGPMDEIEWAEEHNEPQADDYDNRNGPPCKLLGRKHHTLLVRR
jgi:hypothetical protein